MQRGVSLDQDSKVCPECAETIKAAAKVCRYCGHRFEEPVSVPADSARASPAQVALPDPPLFTPAMIVGLALFIIGLPALGALLLYMREQSERTDSPRNEERARSFVVRDFIDPGSAQFRNIVSTDRCVTGEVNAKNRLGGYTGYTPFYFNAEKGYGRVEPYFNDDTVSVLIRFDERQKYEDEKRACTEGEAAAAEHRAQLKALLKKNGSSVSAN